MDLLGKESIILQVGDLKLSDTHNTFGEERNVNGFLYLPIERPDGFWLSQIGFHLAHGDSREGVVIHNAVAEVYLTYGANRMGSNAQSFAIGFQSKINFFFIEEFFDDIYSEKPRLSSRCIIRCKSLFENNNASVKEIYSIYGSRNKSKLSKKDTTSFKKLLSQIQMIEDAVSKSSLSNLRKKELFLKKTTL